MAQTFKRNPYCIIKSRYVTEKATVLGQLQSSASNACTAKCTTPKAVFLVDKRANKQEIARAIEEIYSGRNVKVTAVNTINVKQKKRRVRGRLGMKAGFKKAIVSFEAGDQIDDV